MFDGKRNSFLSVLSGGDSTLMMSTSYKLCSKSKLPCILVILRTDLRT